MSRPFDEMRDELPGYAGALHGSTDGRVHEAHGSLDDKDVRAHLAALAAAWHRAYEALGGAVDFGSNDEVLVSASKGYVLLRVSHADGRYLAVALGPTGNIGFLRYRIRAWLRGLAEVA